VYQDAAGVPVSRDTLLQRMREHIQTVVGRYRGRIAGWDVVNEALDEDGSLRKSPWLTIIGEDYLVKAYQYAHEADPAAELYYNDYSLENPRKRAGAVALVKRLLAAGVPLKAVGLQAHQKLEWPTPAAEDSTIDALTAAGVHVNVTELDVDVLPAATRGQSANVSDRADARAELNPYTSALPDSVQAALARRYEELFRVYLRHRAAIDRVTFWGVADGDSWLNGWPVRGRTNYPLLFDRQHRPKPAFDAVVHAARTASAPAM
jgi:endo-1,4-beta-xylanase